MKQWTAGGLTLPDTTEHKFPRLCLQAWLFCFLLAALCFPNRTQATVFKVGVVGPWSCDPVFAKALPWTAAQVAVNRINRDGSLSLGTTFEYVVLEEDCQTSRALSGFLGYHSRVSAFVGPANPGYCEAASLLGKSWNKAVFSWACISHELDNLRSHPTFARTVPSPSWVLLRFMQHFRWAHVGVISSEEESWVETANKVANALRAHGFPVGIVVTTSDDPSRLRRTLAKVKNVEDLRMIILCMHSALIGGQTQKLLLETAQDMQMTEGSLVFVPYDTLLYSLPYRNVSYPALAKNTKLRRAYDAVLTVTVDSKEKSFFQAFQEAMDHGEVPRNIDPLQVSPLFGTIYSSILFMANAMQRVRDSGSWLSGGNLARHTDLLSFYGFSQHFRTNGSGVGLLDYVVLDTDGLSWELHPTHLVDMEVGMVRYFGRPIHFPNGISPRADSSCWFSHGTICSGEDFLNLFSSLLIISRRRISQIRMVKGPNKILLTLADVTFINPSLSNKKLSFDESKASEIGRSASDTEHSLKSPYSTASLAPATHENSNVAVYEGDWAWLKRLPSGNFGAIYPKTSDVFELMKDMRHENVNPFLGFFHDCGVFAIVTEFCSRGSLEDLLRNEDVKLDWMFKSSLLLDLIKGMKYLHHRTVCHGRLKSRNCVVDGRFVLKVTDYGYNEVLEAQRFPYVEPPAEGQLFTSSSPLTLRDTHVLPCLCIYAQAELMYCLSELLWTAPEVLRGPCPGLHGSMQGDVYSFSIIMQEVCCWVQSRSLACLAEIVQKVRRPPPMCRPVVSLDHAPMECIQLMKQCWTEQPEKRPTFDEIFDQFKNINKGKKTNIIDSMLRMLEQYSSNLEELIRERTEELEIEKQKTEKLLTQMLPPSVAEALKLGSTVEPEYFDNVTLYFSDIVGFTTISANSEPIEVVDLLNDLYTLFDAVIGNHDVYKVETIGDAYMVASGLPVPNGDRHTAEIANMALDILSAVGTFKMRHMPDVPVRIRIGLHTAYRIHVSHSTVRILLELKEGYKVQLRGRTELKGKGMEETYWLVGKDNFTKPLPVPPELKPGELAHGLQMEEIAQYKRRKAEKQIAKKN
ncbi:retinal guanylyl cyclase 2-like [Scleropages formosus]|uniref:guanylate cyclase n=1 Tax=Scleropages formosus TaxID=113540 RepID=A0A0N8JVF1_SCLFO|nr:retinal guanylyl cyclase 2-like [Scleropages formosus]